MAKNKQIIAGYLISLMLARTDMDNDKILKNSLSGSGLNERYLITQPKRLYREIRILLNLQPLPILVIQNGVSGFIQGMPYV